MKGQISLIEAVLSAAALFIAFNMIITTAEYQTKWKESINLVEGRDILITVDRLGRLHDYSFSSASFSSEFLNRIDAIKDAVRKIEIQGTVGNTIYVACDCTAEQISYLQGVFNDVKFNTRSVSASVCSTTLPTINTCGSGTAYPDILIIWRYDSLTPHVSVLTNFLNDGNGLIEITDIQNSKVDGQGADDDEGQKTIFGLKSISEGNFPSNPDEFLQPLNSSQVTYQSYKWFYHSPYSLTAPTIVVSVPVDTLPPPVCLTVREGDFRFQDADHKFWICNNIVSSSVFFDTDNTDKADLGPISKGQRFSIVDSDFKLSYIDATDKIRVSFKPEYLFNDFIVKNNGHNKLAPSNDDKNKVLLSMGYWDANRKKPIAGIILNTIGLGKTAWMADFSRDGLSNTNDDHKQLLASMVLSLADKRSRETFQPVGQITSYINVNSTDILEIYKVELSIGSPF